MALTLVTTTRLKQAAFMSDSPLGQSLELLGELVPFKLLGFFENTMPLGACYNRAIDEASPEDTLVFIHDDVWVDDWMLGWRVGEALGHFNVVGVVGNQRRQAQQETWYLKPGTFDQDIWQPGEFDHGWLSGAISHGSPANRHISNYGPVPQPVRLLDGVFIAVNAGVLQFSGVRFDPALGFHFYDLDFCRRAEQAGLTLGTWPIALTHTSGGGSVQSPAWRASCRIYFSKWEG